MSTPPCAACGAVLPHPRPPTCPACQVALAPLARSEHPQRQPGFFRTLRSAPLWLRLTLGATALVALIGLVVGNTLSRPRCLDISSRARSRFDVPVTGATKASVDSRGQDRWYYSSADGATWLSGADPKTGEAHAPTVPMNSAARAASEIGVDARPSAPVFEGASDSDRAAERSRACARGSPE